MIFYHTVIINPRFRGAWVNNYIPLYSNNPQILVDLDYNENILFLCINSRRKRWS